MSSRWAVSSGSRGESPQQTDASRRPLRAVGRKGLSDAGTRQIRGTRQPKPNSRAGATPRRYITTIVSTTRRGHRSRGKLGVPDPAAICASCCIATNAASRSSSPRVVRWTTTSNLIAVRRLLLAPDDPGSLSPLRPQRYRLHPGSAPRSRTAAPRDASRSLATPSHVPETGWSACRLSSLPRRRGDGRAGGSTGREQSTLSATPTACEATPSSQGTRATAD